MEPLITVFIDEAGDLGVRDGLHYHEDRHEWLCISAFVVRTQHEPKVVDWVRDLRQVANSRQAGALHYHRITAERRVGVCRELATKQSRAFVVASHKSNMREYVNPRLGTKIASDRFYNWAMRLLLERVTDWTEALQKKELGEPAPIRVVFAQRGGHDYDHLFAYIDKLRIQGVRGSLFLKGKGLNPVLLDRSMWSVMPTAPVAGLQLADTIASAFGQAVNIKSPVHDIAPARALRPIMTADRLGCVADNGLMALPFKHQGTIPEATWPIFQYYGFNW